MRSVVIIGAGGHAKVIADIVIRSGDRLLGFLDDQKEGSVFGEYSVIGKLADIEKFKNDALFIIGIGSAAVRERIAKASPVRWYTAIHPSAQFSLGAQIGSGSTVMAGAVINADSVIGKHCIVNTRASVDHDCKIADFVHLSPGSTLCGTVSVGERTQIGAGTVIKNNISVCADVLVGCGSAVVKDITSAGTYVGVPARKV
ncbi:MAG: acetyltransferase [Clostridia bacterium]|nr:acetyltransferase [Clostridia bacterium]